MLKALLLGAGIALMGVLAFSMAACDLDDDGGNSTPGKAVYTGTNGGDAYTLTITEKTSGKAAYTPKTNDSYTLKVNGDLSSGTVSLAQTSGSTLNFTLKPSKGAAAAFTVTVSPGSNKITNVTGTITFDVGEPKTGPGNLSNSNSDGDSSGANVSVNGVTLDLTALNLAVGGYAASLNATVLPAKATTKTVTWTSSNTGVATVNSNGTVTAVSAGSAVITVTTVDRGKTATCAVTVYAKGTKVLTGTVIITGTAEVGKTLKAITANRLDGSGDISYEWKRDGTAVVGYGETYDVTKEDEDCTITVTVTRSGYTGEVTSAPTAPVDDNTIPELTGSVTITGTPEVGQTLTATPSLNGSGTIAYQWMRDETKIGTNSNKYTVVKADEGKTITVTVTRAGYKGSVTSNPITVGPPLTGTVTITGNPEVEQTLKANVSGLSISNDTPISYQWNRVNGTTSTKIEGANKQNYKVESSDLNFKITVTVTCTGYTGSVTSEQTAVVTEVKVVEKETSDGYYKYIETTGGVTITGYIKTQTTVNIPEKIEGKSVTIIGEGAFKDKNLSTVNFNSTSLNKIDKEAFKGNKLTSVTLSNLRDLKNIEKDAFDGNPLTEIYIWDDVTLDESAFPFNFKTVYVGKGRYTRDNASSTEWSKKN